MKSLYSYLRTILIAAVIITLSTGASKQDNKGNPLPHFLFPQFREGIVIMKDGQKFTTLLNYNVVDEKMVTELDGVYRYSKNPASIERIIIDNRTFIPIGNAFYEVLTSGYLTIFLQNKGTFTPKGNSVGYGTSSRSTGPTKMQRYEITSVVYQYGEVAYIDLPENVEVTPASVYWASDADKLEKFNTEKQFIKLFPGYEKQLKDFFRNENINLKNREDVIKLGNYCNEILKK
jgi:hypothetical protein